VLTPDLDLYLESSPREIFVAFEGIARHMPPRGKDETLALGYLFLLQITKNLGVSLGWAGPLTGTRIVGTD
jgi:hypothetical protein